MRRALSRGVSLLLCCIFELAWCILRPTFFLIVCRVLKLSLLAQSCRLAYCFFLILFILRTHWSHVELIFGQLKVRLLWCPLSFIFRKPLYALERTLFGLRSSLEWLYVSIRRFLRNVRGPLPSLTLLEA